MSITDSLEESNGLESSPMIRDITNETVILFPRSYKNNHICFDITEASVINLENDLNNCSDSEEEEGDDLSFDYDYNDEIISIVKNDDSDILDLSSSREDES